MIKEKIKSIFVFVITLMIILISTVYVGYYMFHDGYIASDINNCDCITYVVEQILLSENTPEKKKEMIEKICFYSHSEITVENISDKIILYKKESGFINKKLFKEMVLSAQIKKINNKYYSIEYKTYIPTFYTSIKYYIFLGKHMTRV